MKKEKREKKKIKKEKPWGGKGKKDKMIGERDANGGFFSLFAPFYPPFPLLSIPSANYFLFIPLAPERSASRKKGRRE